MFDGTQYISSLVSVVYGCGIPPLRHENLGVAPSYHGGTCQTVSKFDVEGYTQEMCCWDPIVMLREFSFCFAIALARVFFVRLDGWALDHGFRKSGVRDTSAQRNS